MSSLTHPIPPPVTQSRKSSSSHARATPTSVPLPPASRVVFRRVFLDAASRAPTPPTCLSARRRAKDTLRFRPRCVRAVRSSGVLLFLSAGVGLESANAQGQASGCRLNSNRKRTHVYTLCAGALHGALAGRVQLVKRAARDRGNTFYRLAKPAEPLEAESRSSPISPTS